MVKKKVTSSKILFPLIVGTELFLLYIFFAPSPSELFLNYFPHDFENIYRNERFGYTFRYPKEASIYKWTPDEKNIRIFSKGGTRGPTCDIHINRDVEIYGDTVVYNGISWSKWKRVEKTGSMKDDHFVWWIASHEGNIYEVFSIVEIEQYCEKIVSTFTFL